MIDEGPKIITNLKASTRKRGFRVTEIKIRNWGVYSGERNICEKNTGEN